ncbi:hypothetical protein [Flavobacterium sp. NKUCC04_CG]|uniref:hypothetical protein n=1 Tax=Flavobacterium sp. NKUCC04_CG TaxID=2842121 RepID=UPI001C5B018C|nr:hypothetical protein [Flavobacterium sp. NKUCC04_CG]MBW3519985.1 hypothetical protein [Flavobacterium sp. NKUCC04_CG]
MMLSGGLSSFAQDHKTTSTYYGTKASTNANNPCKGATTRVCGKIESQLQLIEKNEYVRVYDRVQWIHTSANPTKQVHDIIKVPVSEDLLSFLQEEAGYNAKIEIMQ